jgi:hypothetical protein
MDDTNGFDSLSDNTGGDSVSPFSDSSSNDTSAPTSSAPAPDPNAPTMGALGVLSGAPSDPNSPGPDGSASQPFSSGNGVQATSAPPTAAPNQPISWRDVLRGALAGMAGAASAPPGHRTGFVQGAGLGAGAELEQQRKDQQVKMQQQRLQFESAQAADTHVAALDTHRFMQTKSDEAKLDYKQKQANYQNYMQTEFGIDPNLSFNDTDANAIAAGSTLAASNNGVQPPVYTSQMPEPKGKDGTISTYSPTQQSYQSNLAGYRDLVNTGKAMSGQPPLTDDDVSKLGFKGMRDASIATQKALSPTIDSGVTEAQLPIELAKAQQRLSVYSKSPNANQATIDMLSKRVASTQDALKDVQTQAANNAGAKTKAEGIAKLSTPEELAKPGAQAAIQGLIEDPSTSAPDKVQLKALLARADQAQLNVADQKALELKKTQAVTQGDAAVAGKMLADRTLTLDELKSRSVTPQFIASAVTEAQKVDPSFKAPEAAAQARVAGSPANQQFFGNTDSLLIKGGTLDQVYDAGKALTNNMQRVPVFSTYKNLVAKAFGGTTLGVYAASVLGVADDYAKVMGGYVGTDAARQQVINLFDRAETDDQRAAVIVQVKKDVLSQRRGRMGGSPAEKGGNPYLKDMYPEPEGSQPQATQPTQSGAPKQGAQFPAGATKRVQGPDGKWHATNDQGTVDYGVIQ